MVHCVEITLLPKKKKEVIFIAYMRREMSSDKKNMLKNIHLGGGSVVKVWNQEVCFLCDLRFESCDCSYDGHWRFTWSLTSGPVKLVEVRIS
jgi:hypothetical protein